MLGNGESLCYLSLYVRILYAGCTKVVAVLTLYAVRDDASVTFSGTSSTFTVISVQADDGIIQQVHVTATEGHVYLDGDLDNTVDATNSGVIGIRRHIQGHDKDSAASVVFDVIRQIAFGICDSPHGCDPVLPPFPLLH